jgi:hypothetical protein
MTAVSGETDSQRDYGFFFASGMWSVFFTVSV